MAVHHAIGQPEWSELHGESVDPLERNRMGMPQSTNRCNTVVGCLSPPCCQISDRFQAYSPNVVATNICDDIFCEIKLVDVIDHTTCQVNFTGNSNANGLHVSLLPDRIMLEPMFILNPSEPLYINISCNT